MFGFLKWCVKTKILANKTFLVVAFVGEQAGLWVSEWTSPCSKPTMRLQKMTVLGISEKWEVPSKARLGEQAGWQYGGIPLKRELCSKSGEWAWGHPHRGFWMDLWSQIGKGLFPHMGSEVSSAELGVTDTPSTNGAWACGLKQSLSSKLWEVFHPQCRSWVTHLQQEFWMGLVFLADLW